jgi:Ni/Co efflux regulator RcnB
MKSDLEFVMRKFLISLLVASALTPAAALAQNGDVGRSGRSHGERSSQRDNSSDDRPQRAQRAKPAESTEAPVRVERTQGSSGAERAARIERADRPANIVQRPVQVERAERPASIDRVQRPVRVDRAGGSASIDRVQRPVRVEPQPVTRAPVVARRGDRDGFSGLHDQIVQNGDRTDSHHRWNGDWRNDHRYDWRSHRSRYGSLYRLGRYYDPYGWGYRRFSIGFNLWPSYFGSSFWLNDPWQYRLPPAYGPYRWVRYYDDALLVNIYDGQVVDVLYNFFW